LVSHRRELIPASIRNAGMTAAIVFGAPLFITGLAIAGVSIPDDLRSPLIGAGLLTRDVDWAVEADRASLPSPATPTAHPVADQVERGSRRQAEAHGRRHRAIDRRRGGGTAEAGRPVSTPTGGGAPPASPPEATEPTGEAAIEQPAGAEPPAGGHEGHGPAPSAVPSPVENGLDQIDETVDQLEDSLGGLPAEQTSAGVPALGGSE
jgi:hypothetical protein